MFEIYVLACENDKYYVGKTKNSLRRITNHFRGGATAWTCLHRPISVVEIHVDCDAFDEDKITKIYMARFGIDNVRGGSYSTIELDPWMRRFIEHEFITAQDRCYGCGETGHFARDCSVKKEEMTGKVKQSQANMSIVWWICKKVYTYFFNES